MWGATFETTKTISVTNVNEGPTGINVLPGILQENGPPGMPIGGLVAVDPMRMTASPTPRRCRLG